MSLVSAYSNQISQINPRSVLRPEYLLNAPESKCGLYLGDRRYNTNTAPVYKTKGSSTKKNTRSQTHPYGRLSKGSSQSYGLNNSDSHLLQFSEHPALRYSASTVPVRSCMSSPNSDVSSKYTVEPHNRYNQKTNSPRAAKRSGSSRPHGHGQAEQLRRSRESNTFALIDSQLSRPPLNQVRDIYLQNRGTAVVNSSAGRTTKKVNLSVVHTIVRFRVREYLREIHGHINSLLDTILSHTFDDYQVDMRNDLAHKVFGMNGLPCAPECQYCPDVLNANTRPRNPTPYERPVVSNHRHLPCPSMPSPDSSSRPHSSSSNSSTTPMLSASDPHEFSPQFPFKEDSDPELNMSCQEPAYVTDSSEDQLISDIVPKLSPNGYDSRLEQPLPSYHMSSESKTIHRTRLDSFTRRIAEEFETSDWSAEGINLGPCGEEPVDLHALVSDPDNDNLMIKPEEPLFEHVFDSNDIMHHLGMDKVCPSFVQ